MSETEIRRLTLAVDDAAVGLATTYRRVACQALRAGRPLAHERLAEAARDCLVAFTHGLARTIDQSLALIAMAAAGHSAKREIWFDFNTPADERELATFTPTRLAYARDATLRALNDAEHCRLNASQALPATCRASSDLGGWLPEPAAPAARAGGFWHGVCSFTLGLLIADALFDGD